MSKILILGNLNAVGVGRGILTSNIINNNIFEFNHTLLKVLPAVPNGAHFSETKGYNTKDINGFNNVGLGYYLAYYLNFYIPGKKMIVSCGDFNGNMIDQTYLARCIKKIRSCPNKKPFDIIVFCPSLSDSRYENFTNRFDKFKKMFADYSDQETIWYLVFPRTRLYVLDTHKITSFDNVTKVPEKFSDQIDPFSDYDRYDLGYFSYKHWSIPNDPIPTDAIPTLNLSTKIPYFITRDYLEKKSIQEGHSLYRTMNNIIRVLLIVLCIFLTVLSTTLHFKKSPEKTKEVINETRNKVK
ncbi:hypothetical protein [Carp edema virus]|nr:hypothetical protein [Carp edema virus]